MGKPSKMRGIGDGRYPITYSDAVNNGWIAPSIYGWFQNSYEPYVRLMPFSGYWVNTSRQLDVKIRPYYLDSDGNDLGRESVIATSFELNARDISGEGSSDFITVGLSENADNKHGISPINTIKQNRVLRLDLSE